MRQAKATSLGVGQILRYFAEQVRGYGNRLKWNQTRGNPGGEVPHAIG